MDCFSSKILLLIWLQLIICSKGLAAGSGSCSSASGLQHRHHSDHEHNGGNVIHNDGHECGHFDPHDDDHHKKHHHPKEFKLQEELAEEEDLRLYGFGSPHQHEDNPEKGDSLTKKGLWLQAMGCSLLVSMASLICLVILPLIVWQGKPSKTVVDSLAAFGAGAMLGDSFLHQLPHALGGSHNHHHSHHGLTHEHGHSHTEASGHSIEHQHSHSLEELTVGLAALGGMLLFFLVEKIVRYVENHSVNGMCSLHAGHHHGTKSSKSSRKENDSQDTEIRNPKSQISSLETETNGEASDGKARKSEALRKRNKSTVSQKAEKDALDLSDAPCEVVDATKSMAISSTGTNLVIGYLNLFSDGVHNFTDGMALGSAFLLHGSIGGWSRTLFLLAHELPQEVGDFGILVGSGFNVFTALFFNFLSALVALAGTALALCIGSDPGHSSWIEGFTAGGFIYIAMVGVIPEMHQKETSLRSTLLQLISLMSGMAVALCISLLE
eukprot:TRINITY_DN25840_c0_g1_i1.p1 TRINITY_DN25840_c0_g1~~TRINITY_DN25840_c0_g1_i1.p1  ORF type:complete len:495 (+),score=105.01 TRINITY_DN25840_c0_g1_i1:454-1938(+)